MRWKAIRDQIAHMAAASVAVFIVAVPQAPVAAGGILGLALGIVREVTEWQLALPGKGEPWSAGSLRDLAFWTLGGAATGLLLL